MPRKLEDLEFALDLEIQNLNKVAQVVLGDGTRYQLAEREEPWPGYVVLRELNGESGDISPPMKIEVAVGFVKGMVTAFRQRPHPKKP